MAYTGKKIETKIYDVFTKKEAIQNSTPSAVSDKTNTATGYFDLPAGTTAERPATPDTGMLRFNTELDQLEQYTSESGWQGISAPPTITTTDVNNIDESDSTQTVVITGQNFDAAATASLVDSNGVTKTPTTSVRNSSSQITITYSGGDVVTSAVPEPLDVKVVNGSGLSAILEDAINIDATPIWTTSSGSVGTVLEDQAMSSIAVVASDPEGSSVSYLVTGGALPSGTTLSSGGIITGTPNVNDTYNPSGVVHNFTVAASDGTGNSTPRAFSILRKWADGSNAASAAPNAEYIKSITGTTTNGEYYIACDDGTARLAFCDMSIEAGGWVGIMTIKASDGIRWDWGNAIWTNDTAYGSNSTFYSAAHKSNVWRHFSNWTEIMVLNHNTGSANSLGRYELLSAYNSYSFYDLLMLPNTNYGTKITGTRLYQWGDSGWTSNPNRGGDNSQRCEFTDSGTVNSRELRINWRSNGPSGKYSLAGDTYNYVHFTTGQGDPSQYGSGGYEHSYGGIGGQHERGGYWYYYDYSGYAEYCAQPMKFTSDVGRGGTTCSDSPSVVNRDVSIFVR
jgi:hypothetical protein